MSEPYERPNAVKIFMDESGNGHPSLPLIVGAVELGEDADDIEEQIRNLYENLSSRRSLAGLRSFEEYCRGWRLGRIPHSVSRTVARPQGRRPGGDRAQGFGACSGGAAASRVSG